ncbi:MAG: hypothetical protein A3D99_02465, partial [Candidatus Andersenbacteria bacterium RIFCSPHIGHO2_12_FULL_45_11]
MKAVYIVIPAYDEEKLIGQVVQDVAKEGFTSIIVVDDGSSDTTSQAAQSAGAIVIRHRINRGKGAATRTGIEAAVQLGADIVVTMDGDGQHSPKDIHAVIQPIMENKYEVVLGSRQISKGAMPSHKIVHNKIANTITLLYSGIRVQDSQSGFRAYSRHACTLLDTTSDSYEYESEIIRLIAAHKLSYVEAPISTLYTDYSTSKLHKQDIS